MHPEIHHNRVVIVSGLSGSGKTTAVRALEDVGFYCIDNLPVPLIEPMLVLAQRANMRDLAFVVDVRERTFLGDYSRVVERIRGQGHEVLRLFLDAADDAVITRFRETRRRHPLQGDGSIEEGIAAERELLGPIRAEATHLIDTTGASVHSLRRQVQAAFRAGPAESLLVRVESFGFKNGMPLEADYVFDVRFLQNPFFVPALRHQRGTDPAVAEFVMAQPEARALLDHMLALIRFALPHIERDGRGVVTVAVGCTGGHHRSVTLAEQLGRALLADGLRVNVEHRDTGHDA